MNTAKWKPIWKGYVLYDFNNMIFWKSQNYKESKKVVVAGAQEEAKGSSYLLSTLDSSIVTLCICQNP
jgi:hypothetical protein